MRALIVEDGASRGALAAVRALGRAGWFVGVGSPDSRGLAASSRWTEARHDIPVATDLDAFASAVEAAVSKEGYALVFGAGDAEVLALSRSRDRWEAGFPYPPHAELEAAMDKLSLTQAAGGAGVATPETYEDPDDIPDDSFPVFVKARLHSAPGTADSVRMEVTLADSRDEARQQAAAIASLGGAAIFQESIAGDLIAYTTVIGPNGDVVAELQQRADRTWPPGAGASTRARTVAVDPDLAAKVQAMLSVLHWRGLAEVQLIQPPDQAPRLIDLNGRFYGSLALATKAGLALPAIWAAAAVGTDADPATTSARVGARYQWLEGDLRRALKERRGGLLADLLGCLALAPASTHSIWSWTDPRPGLGHATTLIKAVARRGRRAG